jgi:hypothetical protein
LYFKTILKGTTVVVWNYHKNVLKAGGFAFYHFYNACEHIINELLQMIEGQKEIPAALAPLQFEKLIA